MVYFDSWDEFAKAVEQLYLAEPNRVSIFALLCCFQSLCSLFLGLSDDLVLQVNL